jgi:hypothetical protein
VLNRVHRILSAQIVGFAEAHARTGRLERDEALAAIAGALAGLAPMERANVLADAAAAFVAGASHANEAATELLAAAGADLEEARRICAVRDALQDPFRMAGDRVNGTRLP